MGTDNNPPIDYSPSSGAVDEAHAAQDQGTDTAVGRYRYMDNATTIGDEIPAPSQDDDAWSDADDSDGTGGSVYYDTLNQLNRAQTAASEEHIEERRRRIDSQNDIISWGRQIGLNAREIAFSTEMMDTLDTGTKRTHGCDTLVLASLTLAANHEDVTTTKSIRDNGVDTGHHDLVEHYTTIRDDLNISPEAVTSARSTITSEM